jgi:cytochrome c5
MKYGSLLAALALALSGAAAAEVSGYEPELRAYNLAHGRVVFHDKCMGCHEAGKHDAPVLGETAEWLDRIAQPLDTLIHHAVDGHGDMPPRGDQDLTDREVAAAVAYVVHRTRVLADAAGELDSLPASAAGSAELAAEEGDGAIVHMFLLLIGKDRWR